MSIPEKHQGRYVYHMTHMNNLENIIQNGLLCTNKKEALGIKHTNMAYQSIQERRAEMIVPCHPGGKVHDYVPFYFCARDPMLLAQLNNKNIDQHLLVIFGLKIDILEHSDNIFTSFAANSNTPPAFYNNPTDLDKLNWPIIQNDIWKYRGQDRLDKMAELLVYHEISFDEIGFIVVFNKGAKESVEAIVAKNDVTKQIKYGNYNLSIAGHNKNMHHYYTRFMVPSETNKLWSQNSVGFVMISYIFPNIG